MNKALFLIGACLAGCGQASAAPAENVVAIERPAASADRAPVDTEREPWGTSEPAGNDDPDSAHDRSTIAELERALELYETFIARAGDDPAYAEAITRSRERIADIRDTLIFLGHGLRERAEGAP
jgi:hypothetical protein